MQLKVDLRQMVIAIESMVSLVGMNDTNHGKRVAYITSQLAHRLGYDELDVQFAFDLGLLHDCGVSTQQMHAELINNFDWNDTEMHCEIGFRLLENFDPLARFARPIRYHHTHWNRFDGIDIDERDRSLANLVFLADRVDVLACPHYGRDILLARGDIENTIAAFSGRYFAAEIVDALRELARVEAFWIALEDRHITRYAWDMGRFRHSGLLSNDQLRHLAMIMAYIVDQKSPFTTQHSTRVAGLARYLGQLAGLDAERCDQIEIAGLLHDIGKLHMPDRILEKPGPLTESERSLMNQHSFETYELLRRIDGMEEIASWAAYHHEGVNGVGYPFHPESAHLGIEARVIAVADVFQALVQNRPYRKGMPLRRVIGILEDSAREGRLDRELVALAIEHRETCFEIANGQDPRFDGSQMSLLSPGVRADGQVLRALP